jgi:hypothetical protein
VSLAYRILGIDRIEIGFAPEKFWSKWNHLANNPFSA